MESRWKTELIIFSLGAGIHTPCHRDGTICNMVFHLSNMIPMARLISPNILIGIYVSKSDRLAIFHNYSQSIYCECVSQCLVIKAASDEKLFQLLQFTLLADPKAVLAEKQQWIILLAVAVTAVEF